METSAFFASYYSNRKNGHLVTVWAPNSPKVWRRQISSYHYISRIIGAKSCSGIVPGYITHNDEMDGEKKNCPIFLFPIHLVIMNIRTRLLRDGGLAIGGQQALHTLST